MVVDSYASYEWRKCLPTRQSKLSIGHLHLIKGTQKFYGLSCWQETPSTSSKKFNSSFQKHCSNRYSKCVASSFVHKLGSQFRRFRASKNYNTKNIQCVERLCLGVADDGSLLKERGIHCVQRACSFAWLMSDLCLKNEAYTVCSALLMSDLCLQNEAYVVCSALIVRLRALCRIFAYRTRHTSVQRACSFAWLMSDLCLQDEAYIVCTALVRSRGLCRIFAYRTRHTQCVARLFVPVAYVGSLLIERSIHSVQSACSFAWLMKDLCLKNNEYD